MTVCQSFDLDADEVDPEGAEPEPLAYDRF